MLFQDQLQNLLEKLPLLFQVMSCQTETSTAFRTFEVEVRFFDVSTLALPSRIGRRESIGASINVRAINPRT